MANGSLAASVAVVVQTFRRFVCCGSLLLLFVPFALPFSNSCGLLAVATSISNQANCEKHTLKVLLRQFTQTDSMLCIVFHSFFPFCFCFCCCRCVFVYPLRPFGLSVRRLNLLHYVFCRWQSKRHVAWHGMLYASNRNRANKMLHVVPIQLARFASM